MNPLKISNEQARNLILHRQGLQGEELDTLQAIERLSYVQIDPLAVAERAHHLQLFNRNRAYQKEDLYQLLEQDRSIFEYWSHAAAYQPMKDYRFSLFLKSQYVQGKKHWRERDPKMIREVMNVIRKEGAKMSRDFEDKDQRGAWFDWKPAKVALEQAFMEGLLMVTARKSGQKVYDLPERVLPPETDTKSPTEAAWSAYLIDRAIQSQALVSEKEIGYLRKGTKDPIRNGVAKALREKRIVPVQVEGVEQLYYADAGISAMLEEASVVLSLSILSPFDNLIIQRARVQQLFHFDYLLECYVPAAKRKFGYYTMPILWGNQFVGRLDPKADRKRGIFQVLNLWLEADFVPDDFFLRALAQELHRLAAFCGCNTVDLQRSSPRGFQSRLKRLL